MERDPFEYWVNLSIEERTKILEQGQFWTAFNSYKWVYLPDTVKTFVEEKLVH